MFKKLCSGSTKHESMWHEGVVCENEAGRRNCTIPVVFLASSVMRLCQKAGQVSLGGVLFSLSFCT